MVWRYGNAKRGWDITTRVRWLCFFGAACGGNRCVCRGVGFLGGGVGFCTQVRTTSPCGGRRSLIRLFSARPTLPSRHLALHCGDGARSYHLFFASAKKTNEKKADPAGGRAIAGAQGAGFVVWAAVLLVSAVTGLQGSAMACPMGFVVRPLTSCAVPIPTSAVRGARGCAVSGVAGFVVLSRRAGAVMFERDPRGPVRHAHHETKGVDSKVPLALVRQGIKWLDACRQRQNHETTDAGGIVALGTANGRCGKGHCTRGQGRHHETHGARHCDALRAGWTRQPTHRAVRRNHRGPQA